MGSWNGLDLQTELSDILGDTSTAFKANILKWINDIQNDVCTRFTWPFLRQKGKKVLTASSEQQSLIIGPPTAPTVALAAGGSLVAASVYSVIVTFYEGVADIESQAGTASSDVTATAANGTISVTAIPTSSDPLVTARKIYLVKDSGEPLFVSTISDNTTTTTTITADTTSTIEAPDYSYFNKLSGNPFFESTGRFLEFQTIDQLRLMYQGTWSSGTPYAWSDIEQNSILLYPMPSSALTISFYYFKMPKRIFAESTSAPDIPVWLKPVLKAGVIAMGYEYRDRSGAQIKLGNYQSLFNDYVSKQGANKKIATRVRDVVGDSDGRII